MNRTAALQRSIEILDRVHASMTQLDQDKHTLLDRIKLGLRRSMRLADAADTEAVDDTGRPLHADPTGDAGLAGAPNTRAVMAEWDRGQRMIWEGACILEALATQHSTRPASAGERLDSEKDKRGEGCRVHRQAGHHADIVAKGLCRWCYDRERNTGQEPTPDEADAEHRGKRVYDPA